jgi:hypothetical protein
VTATAPSGQDAEANAPDAQCPAGPPHCKVEAALVKGDPALMDETASLNRERASQSPASPGEQPVRVSQIIFSRRKDLGAQHWIGS